MKLVLLLSLFAVGCRAQEEAGSKPEEGAEGAEGEKSKRDIVAQYSYCQEDDCYALLGVKKTSAQPAIKRAYRKLALVLHPDKRVDGVSEEEAVARFQTLVEAFKVRSVTGGDAGGRRNGSPRTPPAIRIEDKSESR